MIALKLFKKSFLLFSALLLLLSFSLVTHANEPITPFYNQNAEYGVNLNANTDWNDMGYYVNLFHQMRKWGQHGTGFEANLAWNDQCVPTQPSSAVFFPDGYPSSVEGDPSTYYTLSYRGQPGSISFAGAAYIVEGTEQHENGITTAKVFIYSQGSETVEEGPIARVNIDNANGGDLRDLKLVPPGYENSNQMFRNEVLKRLIPFRAIRFMQWNVANNTIAEDWNLRRSADCTVQAVGYNLPDDSMGGVAWEHQIELANETLNDAWISVPPFAAFNALDASNGVAGATDTYVRELAKLWRDQLDPQLNLYVEFSNEVWNNSFATYGDITEKFGNNDYYYTVAPLLKVMSDIFKEEWGAESDRIKIVLAGQAASSWHIQRALERFVDNGLNPADIIDNISIAPYISAWSMDTSNPSLSAYVQAVNNVSWQVGVSQEHAAFADQHGLNFTAYEGGIHAREGVDNYIVDSQNQPGIITAYQSMQDGWEDAGGDLFMKYYFGDYGGWGLISNTKQPGSLKFNWAMDMLLDKGDANLDGSVTMADAVIVAQHFNQSGQWWEQGDFNSDGSVNQADVDLMAQNMGTVPSTFESAWQALQSGDASSMAAMDPNTTPSVSDPLLPDPEMPQEPNPDPTPEETQEPDPIPPSADPPVNTTNPFSDISGHWAEADILNLYSRGVVSGYDDQTFRPNAHANRVEVLKMLLEALDVELQITNQNPFPDVPNDWFRNYVYTAVNLNIVTGYADGLFRPANNASRAEVMAMIVRASGLPEENASIATNAYNDVNVNDWFASVISTAQAQGWIQGYADGGVHPNDRITRAEVVKLLSKLIDSLAL